MLTSRFSSLGLASFGLQPVLHIGNESKTLVGRRAGRIVVRDSRVEAIDGRWWPHSGNLLQVWWDRQFRAGVENCCQLFYSHPWRSSYFLTLSYVRAGPKTSPATLFAAGLVLDEIARLKQSAAIVTHISNSRISHRALERWGWQAHCENWKGRHYIKRFYGNYPTIADHWRKRLMLDPQVMQPS